MTRSGPRPFGLLLSAPFTALIHRLFRGRNEPPRRFDEALERLRPPLALLVESLEGVLLFFAGAIAESPEEFTHAGLRFPRPWRASLNGHGGVNADQLLVGETLTGYVR